MKHGSLFSGIGGFDLAAEWMGWENIFHCEWNPFGQKVLKYHFPNAISYEDITKTDFTIHRGRIDILTGGFPCQPYSMAGKRLGKEDERHLWPEMLRAIREIQPRWVVGENVFGLVNWSGGLVFNEVQADLEAEGYEVQPYVLPAISVNAPHRRDRIWFVAYSNNNRLEYTFQPRTESEIFRTKETRWQNGNAKQPKPIKTNGIRGDITNTYNKGLQRRQEVNEWEKCNIKRSRYGNHIGTNCKNNSRYTKCDFINFPTQPPICSRNDGLSDKLDGITFSKWRIESIKAGGNAIVPQVVHQIFKAIEQYEKA
jgi:DNA (cytosine-5)-methyltransferase 1